MNGYQYTIRQLRFLLAELFLWPILFFLPKDTDHFLYFSSFVRSYHGIKERTWKEIRKDKKPPNFKKKFKK